MNVTTGARLHFGLLRTSHPFGGLGVMIDAPQTSVSVTSADRFSCADETSSDGDTAERVTQIAQRFANVYGMRDLPNLEITIRHRPPAHSGLGSGTQLAMAVSQSLVKFFSKTISDAELAREIAGRGARKRVMTPLCGTRGGHGHRAVLE